MTAVAEKKEVPDIVLNFDSDKSESKTRKEESKQEAPKNLEQLPNPTGYRLLILPYKVSDRTKGGIYLADQTREREQVATVVGLILKSGPDAYKDPDKYPNGPWCKDGDWVVFGRYAGARIPIDGGEIRLLNDDEVLAVVDDPEAILTKY
jgi:co-chaperonin GroES (HSP10)